jgi:hypothetical protein
MPWWFWLLIGAWAVAGLLVAIATSGGFDSSLRPRNYEDFLESAPSLRALVPMAIGGMLTLALLPLYWISRGVLWVWRKLPGGDYVPPDY